VRKSVAALIEESAAEQANELVPDPKVAREFGTTLMGLWRWDRDPQLVARGWPPPIRIRGRKFRQNASGCCSAQRNDSRDTAVMESTKIVS
jgi:hypothetical protein